MLDLNKANILTHVEVHTVKKYMSNPLFQPFPEDDVLVIAANRFFKENRYKKKYATDYDQELLPDEIFNILKSDLIGHISYPYFLMIPGDIITVDDRAFIIWDNEIPTLKEITYYHDT